MMSLTIKNILLVAIDAILKIEKIIATSIMLSFKTIVTGIMARKVVLVREL